MKLIYKLQCLVALFISLQMNAQDVYKDVAPIFINNCTSCHHDGGIATSLTSYSKVYALGNTIKAYVNSNTMPPWPPDPAYKNYVHERVVSAADKAKLIAWIDNAMPAGDTTLAPAVPVYGATQLYGTPDLILNVPKFTSTASSSDHYYCLNVPSGLLQDRYIRAFEFVPGNAAIIHHAVITIDTTGTAVDDLSGGCFNFQGQVGIGDYAPGMGPTVLPGVSPTKFGFRIKAGSTLSFQMHVPEGSAGEKDSSQLRIYFYPIAETGVREMYFETLIQNWSFVVPANDSITVTQKYPPSAAGIPVPFSIYGVFPHSHNTCTNILNFAYKTTDTIPLIWIPEWDFHWQGQYTFKNMVKMPQGYRLFSSHKFDNTINNPHTPDPNIPVSAGTNTYDEMLFDSYLFALYQSGDELADIEAILNNDPLFYPTSAANVQSLIPFINVYPNPFQQTIQFEYELASAQFVSLRIYDIFGREVSKLVSHIQGMGFHTCSWNGKSENAQVLPSGNYIYTLKAGKSTKSGMITKQSN